MLDELVKGRMNPNMQPPALAQMNASAAPEETAPMASPEQIQELRDMFGQVQNENARLVSNKVLSRNQLQIMKQKLFGELFTLLQDAGVDPSDPESVKNFLLQLERRDPDLLEIFQTAFTGLSSPESVETETPAPEEGQEETPPASLSERFRNLGGLGE